MGGCNFIVGRACRNQNANLRVEQISNKPVLLLGRFDRDGQQRIPFLSAMSMLNARDYQPRSYLEIADSSDSMGQALT